MAHQLEFVNGKAFMFYVGNTPWHKLGTARDSPPTIEEGKTLWDGYNGVTEYLGTEYGRTHATRLDALWFGASAQLSQKALEVALTMAA
jgi:hypothetical protein